MAVVMRMAWPEVTQEQYDATLEAVGWEENPPDGAIFHVAFFDEGGFKAIDVWESPEKFQTFLDERLSPGIEQVGIEGEPNVTFAPVHRFFEPALMTAGS
jgi:hypothetical protein